MADDPIIQDDPYLQIIGQQDALRDSFFKEASDILDGNAPAEPAPKPAAQATAPTEASKPAAPTTETSKVPGPPQATEPTKPVTEPQTGDDPLAPREYAPGKVKADNWKHLHSLRDQEKQRADKLAAEIEALRKSPQTQQPQTLEQIEALRKANEDLQARLESVAVERSPRFEAQFKPREEAAITLAKQAVGPEKAQKIAELLALPDSTYRNEQIESIMNDLRGLPAAKLQNALVEMDRIALEKQSAAAKSREIYKQWQTEAQTIEARQREERTQKVNTEFEAELSDWQKGVDLLKPTGDPAHDSEVQRRLATAKSVFSGQEMSFRDLARASMWVAIAPDLAGQNSQLKQQVATLEGELQRIRGAQPGRGDDSGTAAPDTEQMDSNMGYMDAIARAAQQAGLLR